MGLIVVIVICTGTSEIDSTARVNYKGTTLNYKWQEKVILLTGEAEVKTPEVTAKADTIKYDANKNTVTASGKPTLWVGSQRIDGKMMVYDLESGEGIVYNGRTQIQRGWFDGKIIRRVDREVLNIDYGKFTTCDHFQSGKSMHYYFWSKELKVYIDDMVFTRPLILVVHGIPVFYAPFWWFPIKKGRKSGLLHPKIGKSSEWGRYVENLSYYWVINEWSDATFTLNCFELKGPMVLVESRWLILHRGSGSFNTSYINEENKYRRWALDATHSQDFGNRLSLRAEGHFTSDVKYKVDYEEERLVQLDKILNSYMSVSKSWDIVTTNFTVHERRNLATDSIVRKVPTVSYSLTQMQIIGGNLRCSGHFTNSSIGEEYKQMLRNTVAFSLPFKLFRYLSISPATSHTFTFERPDTLEYSKHLAKPRSSQYSVSLSTRIYGKSIFSPEFRHTITPSISYSRVYSITDVTRNCSFSARNDFELMLGNRKLTLAALDLRSSWNFARDSLNPVDVFIESRVIPLVNMRANATYFPYVDTAKFNNLVVSSHHSRKGFTSSITYNWVPRPVQSDKSLQIGLDIKLTTNWRLSLSRRHDLIKQKVISESFSVHRDLHCWDMEFNFDKYGETWRYDFQLKLKALPEIKVGKSVFGFLL